MAGGALPRRNDAIKTESVRQVSRMTFPSFFLLQDGILVSLGDFKI